MKSSHTGAVNGSLPPGNVFVVTTGTNNMLPPGPDGGGGSPAATTTNQPTSKRLRSTPCNVGCRAWCLKYFWEGQRVSERHKKALEEVDENTPLGRRILLRYRRPLALLLPGALVHFVWWSVMIKYDLWYLFKEKYIMSITMVFGALVAGMTSEGGGAVAFPVMTLALGVSASVARDFSMLIQAIGMTCASFAIFFMKVKIEWRAIIFGCAGGSVGLICGLEFLDPTLTAPQKKMSFVSVFFAFAFALFLLNRSHKRKTYDAIPNFRPWKALVLVVAGFAGGLFTSLVGSGLDICTFSVLTLFFRVSEKTATPTSVVMMGTISVLGAYWRRVIIDEVSVEAWEYLTVSVPIVVFMAPLGSVIGTHFHRQVLAALVYILDTIALISAFAIVPQTAALAGSAVGIILGGFIFFFAVSKIGEKLLESQERSEKEKALQEKVPPDLEIQPVQLSRL